MGFASLKGFLLSLFGDRATKSSVELEVESSVQSCERSAEAPPRFSREIVIPLDAIDDVIAALQAPSAADQVDYLYLAAEAGRDAKAAAKTGNFDTAWGLFHDQKQAYLQHAQSQGWGARQTLALDASVHEDLADLLRLEKRHREAFPHILYWVAAGRNRPIKRHTEKLRAYFNRCKFKNTSLHDVEVYLSSRKSPVSYSAIQKQVKRWVDAS